MIFPRGRPVGAQGGCTYKGALADMPRWSRGNAPSDMRGDFDHAVMINSPDQLQDETLIIKGDKAMIFHWTLGPRIVGTWAQVPSGLDSLPDVYKKPVRPGELTVQPTKPPQKTPPPPAKSSLTTATPTVAKGAPLTVRYSTPANTVSGKNWVGVYPDNNGATITKEESFVWTYTPDASGSAALDTGKVPGPGSYAAWYFHDDGYTILAGPVVFTVT
ncbi:hypothetical protein ABZ815_28580 [Nonomuraea sp. NPDC047529]|uniref:hypothetical protein n=1 Tax=Nonomuraea sp. NPDC047529 TaxID=3155623 RepID=UPI0033DCB226